MLANFDLGGFRAVNAGAPTAGTDLITRDWWQNPNVPIAGPITINGSLTTDNTTADEVGYKGLPQNSQGNYTLVLTDAGKYIANTSSGTTVTVPPNSSVAFPVGTVVTIVNQNGAGNMFIAQGVGVTITLAGTSTTGTRTLAGGAGLYSVATLLKIATNDWVASGSGLS